MDIPDRRIFDRVQGIANLIQISLQDMYLLGYQDGIDYAFRQLREETQIEKKNTEEKEAHSET